MPLIIPSNSISAGGYEVDNSLRFNSGSSDYLNRTFGTPTNNKIFTWSGWLKRANLSSYSTIFRTAGNPSTGFRFEQTSDIFRFFFNNGTDADFQTTQVFRDVSAWYHIVIAVDTTQGTASNRVKIYSNGSQITSFSTATYPALNLNPQMNSGINHTIGKYTDNTSENYNGYMAEVCFIDGQALDPTSFGEFDADTGIWKPIDVSSLTFGTNGFYLDFESSGSLGNDVSGNGNNFTVNNLTSIDQTTDTPTLNYATLNALVPASRLGTISDGNLKIISSGDNFYSPSTIYVSKGKWYAEFKLTDTTRGGVIGAISSNANLNTSFFGGSYGTGISAFNNLIYNYNNAGGTTSYTGTISQNDIVGIALDMDNKKIYAYHNGSLLTTSITGNVLNDYDLSTVDDYWTIGFGNDSTYTIESNFGNPISTISSGNSDGNGFGQFEYQPPSGYLALCTKNLATDG